MPVTDEIHRLYDGQPDAPDAPPIHPFIGEHFRLATPAVLRVLVMGINCYYSEPTPPGRAAFSTWMRDRAYTFFARAFSESAVLAESLADSPAFQGLSPGGLESLYVTNMVRRYRPAATGKAASSVGDELFNEGAEVWGEELEILQRRQVLPHVVVVFGEQVWGRAWRAFRDRVAPDGAIVSYTPYPRGSDLHHHLNRVVVREGDNERLLLLVKLTHPAARSHDRRAARIVAHPDFRRAAGLEETAR